MSEVSCCGTGGLRWVSAWFRSFDLEEDFRAELTDVVYRSPGGHLLDVAHDVEA